MFGKAKATRRSEPYTPPNSANPSSLPLNQLSDEDITVSRTTQLFSLVAALFAATPVYGQNAYEECSQILSQDIFNKVTKSESGDSASSAETIATFFLQSDTRAFEGYSKAFDEAHKKGTKIDVEGHYGIIGGEVGIDLTSENKVSESEFRSKFNKRKEAFQSSTSSKSSSSQSLVNSYASYVRDPGTVSAWKDCVSRTRETNLYAFASRDRAGKTYVNVMWVPGVLAGSLPSIQEELLAMGSGRNFAISCGRRCDDGFQVTVNGTLRSSQGTATSSFTATVDVPPLKPPSPPECPWEGDWETEWTWGGDTRASAVLSFARDGEGLSGKYRYGNLVLAGARKDCRGSMVQHYRYRR
jgi:hypothetical protein